MMRTVSKMLVVLLVLAMFITACAPASNAPAATDGGDTAAADTPAPAEATQAPDDAAEDDGASEPSRNYEQHITLTANSTNAEVQGNDALWTYFTEMFNVTIELIPMTFNERHEKARIWVSSGDMPDLLWMDLDEKMFAEYANWVRQGMFRAFPSDIREVYPNIGADYNQDVNVGDELMTIDGAQYAHPVIRGNPETDFMSGMSWMYRRDWAQTLDMYNEGDVYTWDEWIALAEAFITQDPGGNGAGKTIGMGTEIFYFPNPFGIYQLSAEYGYGAFSPKDGQYVWTAARPETLEGLIIAKDLYDRGIIWPDNPLGQAPDDQYKAGLMGMDFNNFDQGRTNGIRTALKENFPDINEVDAGALAFVIGPDGTMWSKQSQCYWGAVVMSADIGDDQMERYFSMLDWMLSSDGQYFRAYGIPDVDYSIDASGNVVCLWPENKVYAGLQVDPYPDNVRTWYGYSGGIPQSVAPSVSVPQQTIEDVANKYQYLKDYGFMRSFDYESSYLSAPNKDQSGNFTTEVSDKMIELLTTATADELPNLWNDWIASMEAKVQPVLDELNSMITDIPTEAEPKLYNE